MAVCLLCTCAKESLPWPIEDRFIVRSHLAFIVQPHAWYGTDLVSHPTGLGGVWMGLLNFSRCPIECLDICMEY